ncbi:MAG TPA: response regulator [Streptosporangiaceae bacterium]|nr:response regulator [Streptosporangiaceae bacterium]
MSNIGAGLSRRKILVVEDDPAAARFVVYVLGERGGFDVSHVTDPVVALQRIADEAWDLVLTNLDLPRMTGLDLLASVRRIAPGLPVAITTGRAMSAAHAHALRRHADAFLERPIQPQRLTTVATALIGNRPQPP